jgi:hypothetical protein
VKDKQHTVVVTGDVSLGWNIAASRPANRSAVTWQEPAGQTRAYWQRGDAALLADLVDALGQRLAAVNKLHLDLRQMDAPKTPIAPNDRRYRQTYKQWQLFPYTSTRPEPSVWRMVEWLGMSPAAPDVAESDWTHVLHDTPDADLVVLSDAGLGFRDLPQLWPMAVHNAAQPGRAVPWIVLKMARPLARGQLWEHLLAHYAHKLIVVTTIDDLRQTEVQVSRALSWERTAQDLLWELLYNPQVNALAQCAHLIVSLGAAGAVHLSPVSLRDSDNGNASSTCRLFFDPKVIEGMWEAERPGFVTGYTSCIVAAIAHQLIVDAENPGIEQAIQSGLAALRALHQEGYGVPGGDVNSPVEFPFERIVNILINSPSQLSVTPVRDPGGSLSHQGLWTILEERYRGNLQRVAQQIVLEGLDVALAGVPLARFGGLVTVDRSEIESYRSIGTLVNEYVRQPNPKRPLSIAVFGAPGSGKSFGVTQVTRSLLPGQIEKLEFNLSQFESANQLLDAFHRVRDTGLSGKIPLVFWDEFDTALENQPLGWLRHFLAPMQDGAFQEGQIVHPIGRAIFVFAGGTRETMASFDRGSTDPAFRDAKGPDFVSRLKGFVDVVGPNPKGGVPATDRYFIIRRAILMRFLLQSGAPQIFQRRNRLDIPEIDSGVLRAFLEIPFYKHGARSMESVVATSSLAGKSRFERSSLPTEPILNLHVDGRQFLSLVQRLELTESVLERLAEAAFQVYAASVQSYASPEIRSIYAELSEEEKEQNRLVVRDIPVKLAEAGYVMRPARSGEEFTDFPEADREFLAQLEHERWVRARIADGWQYASHTDPARKTHAALLPWDADSPPAMLRDAEAAVYAMGVSGLPENEKQKNRALIDGIPRILAQAGYVMVKVRGRSDSE